MDKYQARISFHKSRGRIYVKLSLSEQSALSHRISSESAIIGATTSRWRHLLSIKPLAKQKNKKKIVWKWHEGQEEQEQELKKWIWKCGTKEDNSDKSNLLVDANTYDDTQPNTSEQHIWMLMRRINPMKCRGQKIWTRVCLSDEMNRKKTEKKTLQIHLQSKLFKKKSESCISCAVCQA